MNADSCRTLLDGLNAAASAFADVKTGDPNEEVHAVIRHKESNSATDTN